MPWIVISPWCKNFALQNNFVMYSSDKTVLTGSDMVTTDYRMKVKFNLASVISVLYSSRDQSSDNGLNQHGRKIAGLQI